MILILNAISYHGDIWNILPCLIWTPWFRVKLSNYVCSSDLFLLLKLNEKQIKVKSENTFAFGTDA